MPPQLRTRPSTRVKPSTTRAVARRGAATVTRGRENDELAAVEDIIQHEPAIIRTGDRTMVIRHVVLPPSPLAKKTSPKRVDSFIKELPKGKTVTQNPSSRKGGGPSWKPVPYEDALKLQQLWRENRWCLAKIRNEFIGDKELERLENGGTGASEMMAFRQKLLKAYMDLVGGFLAVQTEMGDGGNDAEIVGAKFAYSKIEAIIGGEEAKKLKEAHARITTQVHVWEETWYENLTAANIARAVHTVNMAK